MKLKEGVGQTVSLIDNDLLSKNPMIQTMADKLNEIAQAGANAKKSVEELNAVLSNTKFEMTGKIEVTVLDTAKTKIEELAKSVGDSKSSIKTSITNIQSSLNSLKIGAIDTSAITNAVTEVRNSMDKIKSLSNINGSFTITFDIIGLNEYVEKTSVVVSTIASLWNALRGVLPVMITTMSSNMLRSYSKGSQDIVSRTDWLRQNLGNKFDDINNMIRKKMQTIKNKTYSSSYKT